MPDSDKKIARSFEDGNDDDSGNALTLGTSMEPFVGDISCQTLKKNVKRKISTSTFDVYSFYNKIRSKIKQFASNSIFFFNRNLKNLKNRFRLIDHFKVVLVVLRKASGLHVAEKYQSNEI